MHFATELDLEIVSYVVCPVRDKPNTPCLATLDRTVTAIAIMYGNGMEPKEQLLTQTRTGRH